MGLQNETTAFHSNIASDLHYPEIDRSSDLVLVDRNDSTLGLDCSCSLCAGLSFNCIFG